MNSIITWLDSHKTKLTGLALVLLGSVQANLTHLQAVLSPKSYALATIVVGLIVTAIGFWNSKQQ